MEAQCPEYGNWWEYKKVDTLTRKATRMAVRKDNVTVASAIIVSDADILIWAATGFAADIPMNDYLNERVKKAKAGDTTILKNY
ncbi:hypothetical protein [Phocaeicola sp.]|uniref:hypothetical protein n=1 Tax=Phocaeicola sp. TaxID=2773926 RepID=UPI0023BEFEBD|nr:hypothetical protein [Phocaeicola sp.]MDE5677849.1 hypothetical protein [Phocaeicola sp.]